MDIDYIPADPATPVTPAPRVAPFLEISLVAAFTFLLGAATCGAEADAPTTAGVAATTRAIGTRDGWNIALSEPCIDTLDAPVHAIVDAARRCLRADDWRIQSEDPERGDMVTRWKELQHPLVKMLLGKVEARCAVAMTPFTEGRTVVTFQGALCSRDPLEQNPSFRLAMRAYRNAAHDWQREVRRDLHWQEATKPARP